MVRTAILGGILLVLLAIAADRPGTLPNLPRLALVPADAPRAPAELTEAIPAKPFQKPAAAPKPPVVEEEAEEVADVESAPEPQIEEEVAVAPPAPIATPVPAVAPTPAPAVPAEPAPTVAAVAPTAPPLPVTQPGAPLRLLPPVMEPPVTAPQVAAAPVIAAPAAAPAPLTEIPDVSVPSRPLFKPANELPRGANVAQMPEIPAPPAAVFQDASLTQSIPAQTGEAPVKFMSREERSRELYRLAREMENTFMDKLAR